MEETSPSGLRVRLLGRFEVWHGQELLPQTAWPQHKTQRLLQLLLSERGQVFSCERLCDLLFPDLDPQKALESLYGRISEPRGSAEQWKLCARPSVLPQLYITTPNMTVPSPPCAPSWEKKPLHKHRPRVR